VCGFSSCGATVARVTARNYLRPKEYNALPSLASANLRHSDAVGALQLRDYMGHASGITTQLYIHHSQEHGCKVMQQTSL
jgi:hypothetical protein